MIARLLIIASVVGFIAVFGVLTNLAYPEFSQKQIDRITGVGNSISTTINEKQNAISQYSSNTLGNISNVIGESVSGVQRTVSSTIDNVSGGFGNAVSGIKTTTNDVITTVNNGVDSVGNAIGQTTNAIASVPSNIGSSITNGFNGVTEAAQNAYIATEEKVVALFDFDIPELNNVVAWPEFASNTIYQNDANDKPSVADLLAGIEPAAGGTDDLDGGPPDDFGYEFEIEDEELISEAVLVPRAKTVISSSRDGKIKKVHFKNGDHFKKGDVILEYHCADVKAELKAASAERKFARQKHLTTSRLFNMDLSSTLEVEQSHVEKHQAQAKKKTIETRINDCIIRADYDGRVVKRMANDNEYTRTDRVLMEIAAKDTLDIEFLLPSKSLRWVNIGAPITILVNETDREYTGVVKQIYGEVDPVSQSIQIRAGLDDYQEPLLPGMSGQVTIDVRNVRQAGISGFLETQTQ